MCVLCPCSLSSCLTTLAVSSSSLVHSDLFFGQADEIKNLSVSENIEQHARRRHIELDNLFQVRSWMCHMGPVTKNKLDPNKLLDIVKYATIMGDPQRPMKVICG